MVKDNDTRGALDWNIFGGKKIVQTTSWHWEKSCWAINLKKKEKNRKTKIEK